MRVAPVYFVLSVPWLFALIAHGQPLFEPLIATVLFWPVTPHGLATPVMGVGWTLCFELIFYTAVAFTVGRSRLVALGMLALFMGCLLLHIASPAPLWRFLGNPIILEFLFGVMIALQTRPLKPLLGAMVVILAALLIAAAAVHGLGRLPEAQMTMDGGTAGIRVIVFGLPAAAIVWGGLQLESLFRGRLVAAAARIGDASYSIYLTHWGTLMGMAYVVNHLVAPPALIIPLGLISATLVGLVAYQFIERPVLAILRPRPRSAAPLPVAA